MRCRFFSEFFYRNISETFQKKKKNQRSEMFWKSNKKYYFQQYEHWLSRTRHENGAMKFSGIYWGRHGNTIFTFFMLKKIFQMNIMAELKIDSTSFLKSVLPIYRHRLSLIPFFPTDTKQICNVYVIII